MWVPSVNTMLPKTGDIPVRILTDRFLFPDGVVYCICLHILAILMFCIIHFRVSVDLNSGDACLVNEI